MHLHERLGGRVQHRPAYRHPVRTPPPLPTQVRGSGTPSTTPNVGRGRGVGQVAAWLHQGCIIQREGIASLRAPTKLPWSGIRWRPHTELHTAYSPTLCCTPPAAPHETFWLSIRCPLPRSRQLAPRQSDNLLQLYMRNGPSKWWILAKVSCRNHLHQHCLPKIKSA